MPLFSSNYLLPAILLNPAFVLHLINTFVSHIFPPPATISHSPHSFMESLGPRPGSTLYLDVHADERLCWGYTGIMVVLQMLAIGRVQDNRDRRRQARATRLERETGSRQKLDGIAAERKSLGLDGGNDSDFVERVRTSNGSQEHPLTGLPEVDLDEEDGFEEVGSGLDSDTSTFETSEEEMLH